MSVMCAAATLEDVDVGMGARIKARRTALGISVKALAERAGVDRGRLAALEAGDPTIRETTVGAVERALAQLEHEMGMDPRDLGEGLVEFVVEGNFGVRAVVKGPVGDIAKLQAAAEGLVERMQRGRGDDDTPNGEPAASVNP